MTEPANTHGTAADNMDNSASAPVAGAAAPTTAVAAAVATATGAAAEPAEAVKPKGRLRGRRRADAENALEAEAGNTADPKSAVDRAIAAPVAASKPPPQRVVRVASQIPLELLNDAALAQAIAVLPSNYNFELYKTIWRVREAQAKMVALQFPEGLLMYACVISDILQRSDNTERFANVETLIMGDVTYGACCVDDYTARALGCDFMIHYGHSCLVPIDVSTIHMLYVFVDIAIDSAHLIRSMIAHFPQHGSKIVIAGTIQFATALAHVAQELSAHFGADSIFVPQAKPLSKGEVLGCTSPKFDSSWQTVVFLADGRFHLESLMIANPHIKEFFKYDPYGKKLTRESYGYDEMHRLRKEAIATATKAKRWGLILGTLGRQGNVNILSRIESLLQSKNLPYTVVLLSEIFPDKLARMSEVEAWVQVACPRLSIDWGYAFHTPLLSPYEAEVALQQAAWQEVYPMDYYRADGGSWSNYHAATKQSLGGGAAGKDVNPIRARKEAKAAAAAAAAAAAEGTKPKTEIAYAVEE